MANRWKTIGMAIAAAIGVSGCSAYDSGYGYGGVSLGYGNGYYDPGYYNSGYYGGLGYGWFGDYYYPGNGYYVFDRGGRRFRWNDNQRRYWEARRNQGQWNGQGRPGRPGSNWQGGAGRPDRPTQVTPGTRPDRPWQGRERFRQRGTNGGAVVRQNNGVSRPATRSENRSLSRARSRVLR